MASRTPVLFHGEDLVFFELAPTTFSETSLRRQYLKLVLKYHPDKSNARAGNRERFKQAKEIYERLLHGLQDFKVWCRFRPHLTMVDVVSWTPANTRSFASSAGQPAGMLCDRVLELAPKWHINNMQDQVRESVKDALQQLRFDFAVELDDMAASLTCLEAGETACFFLRGAEQPATPRYRGTSWLGLVGISERGFLPSWGAGRAQALQRFGIDLPVVYTSPVSDTALWYPLAMVDKKGQPVGERVAVDTPAMRFALIIDADVSKRRIKIRRGRNNKQDAWLPEDLTIRGVLFHGMDTAANEVKPEVESGAAQPDDNEIDMESGAAQPDDNEIDMESGAAQPESNRGVWAPPDDDEVDMIIAATVARQLMETRIHKDDPRSDEQVAYDVVQLVWIRESFVRRHGLNWWEPLSPENTRTMWNEDLRALFLEDRGDDDSQPPWKRFKFDHNVFRVWLRERFGNVRAIRKILQEPMDWNTFRELQRRENMMLE